eukprot:15404559-Alexandrium_andersonii.AAC.1
MTCLGAVPCPTLCRCWPTMASRSCLRTFGHIRGKLHALQVPSEDSPSAHDMPERPQGRMRAPSS